MKKLSLYLLLLVNLIIIFYFWSINSFGLLFQGSDFTFISLGRLTGLLAAFFVLLQLILIGRVKWTENIFGLDKLSILHHWVGLGIPFFVILHPLLIIFGYKGDSSFWAQSWLFITDGELLTAHLAGLIFLAVAGTSVYIVFSKKLKYEWWYFIHLAVYLGILWSFEHQLELGGDFINSSVFASYWWFLYVFAIGNLILFRFLRPVYYFYLHRFQVDRIVEECPGVWSVYIIGKSLEQFNFKPGQFAIWRFLDKTNWWQAHPFSFSAVPNGKYLRITIKSLGDFTSQISQIKPGTFVLLDGPSGIFTASRTKNDKILLIAGGVGVTPIRGLLEDFLNLKKDLVLMYGSRSKKDIIFEKEITDISTERAKICHILNDNENWDGETGKIDEEKIKRLAPDYLERDIFLCGPPLMMKGVRGALQKLGVKKSRIYFEKFSLGS